MPAAAGASSAAALSRTALSWPRWRISRSSRAGPGGLRPRRGSERTASSSRQSGKCKPVGQAQQPVAERQIGAAGHVARREFGGLAVLPLAQIGDDRRIDRDAGEILQQYPAMGRRIGTDALQSEQIIVAKTVVPAFAVRADRAVFEHPAGRGEEGCGAETELGALTQPRLAVVEDHTGFRKSAAARLGNQRRRHAARADQLVLIVRTVFTKSSEKLEQRRMRPPPRAISAAARGSSVRNAAIAAKGSQSTESQRPTRRRISGAAAAAKPCQRTRTQIGSGCAIATVPRRPPIRSRRARIASSGSQRHGASCAQPWLATVSLRSIGQRKRKTLSLTPSAGRANHAAVPAIPVPVDRARGRLLSSRGLAAGIILAIPALKSGSRRRRV